MGYTKNKRKHYGIRISEELLTRAEILADKKGLSTSEIIRIALSDYLQKYKELFEQMKV